MHKRFIFSIFLAFLLFLPLASNAGPRQDVIAGPLVGDIVGIYDGDTVTVRLHVWIGQDVETAVRINGIDAPEMHGKCDKERAMAESAKDELSSLLTGGKISLTNIRLEKYAGRVLANAATADGVDISRRMIDLGFARAYHGEKRRSWCG